METEIQKKYFRHNSSIAGCEICTFPLYSLRVLLVSIFNCEKTKRWILLNIMLATFYVVIAMSMYRSRHTGGICLSQEQLVNLNVDRMFPLQIVIQAATNRLIWVGYFSYNYLWVIWKYEKAFIFCHEIYCIDKYVYRFNIIVCGML